MQIGSWDCQIVRALCAAGVVHHMERILVPVFTATRPLMSQWAPWKCKSFTNTAFVSWCSRIPLDQNCLIMLIQRYKYSAQNKNQHVQLIFLVVEKMKWFVGPAAAASLSKSDFTKLPKCQMENWQITLTLNSVTQVPCDSLKSLDMSRGSKDSVMLEEKSNQPA